MRRLVVLAVTVLVVAMASLLLPGVASAWSWPVDGAVLRPFTLGADPYAAGQHRGIDVAGVDGGPVRAPAGGSVTFAGSVPTHGRTVAILTADGYSVTIAHLGSIQVAKGQAVDEGAVIGTLGDSGTPEHAQAYVHLGVRVVTQEQGYVDPAGFLPSAALTVEPVSEPVPPPVEASAMEPAPAAAPPPPPEAPAATAPQATQGPDPVPTSPPASASQAGQVGADPPAAADQPPAAQVATAAPAVPTPAAEPVRMEPAQPFPASAPSGTGMGVDPGLEVETAAPVASTGSVAGPAGEVPIAVAADHPTGDRPVPPRLPIAVAALRPVWVGGDDARAHAMRPGPDGETPLALSVTRAAPARPRVGGPVSMVAEPVTALPLGREASAPVDGVAGRSAAAMRFAGGRFTDRESPNWSIVSACVALILLLTTAGAVVRRAPPHARTIGRHGARLRHLVKRASTPNTCDKSASVAMRECTSRSLHGPQSAFPRSGGRRRWR